jgi:hypothetical protein
LESWVILRNKSNYKSLTQLRNYCGYIVARTDEKEGAINDPEMKVLSDTTLIVGKMDKKISKLRRVVKWLQRSLLVLLGPTEGRDAREYAGRTWIETKDKLVENYAISDPALPCARK